MRGFYPRTPTMVPPVTGRNATSWEDDKEWMREIQPLKDEMMAAPSGVSGETSSPGTSGSTVRRVPPSRRRSNAARTSSAMDGEG